jgi:hypothetical protein
MSAMPKPPQLFGVHPTGSASAPAPPPKESSSRPSVVSASSLAAVERFWTVALQATERRFSRARTRISPPATIRSCTSVKGTNAPV